MKPAAPDGGVHPITVIPDFGALIEAGEDAELSKALRRAETVGRPLGEPAFMDWIEGIIDRKLKPANPGAEAPGWELSALSP